MLDAFAGRRAAQKAFRARKKEREAAKEAQLRELSDRLNKLELEKRALLARNVLLERAVAASAVPGPGSAPGSPGSPLSAPPPAQVCCLCLLGASHFANSEGTWSDKGL